MFTDKFMQDYQEVWYAIGYDCCSLEPAPDELEVAELILDADRLTMYGSAQSQDELRTVLTQNSIEEVQEHLVNRCPLGCY